MKFESTTILKSTVTKAHLEELIHAEAESQGARVTEIKWRGTFEKNTGKIVGLKAIVSAVATDKFKKGAK